MHTILFVEDHPPTMKLVARALERELCVHVTSVSTKKEACSIVESIVFDVIVLDYWLPDGNGLEVFRSLRHKNVWTPAVLYTNADFDVVKDGLAGFNCLTYVSKQESIMELLKRVRDALYFVSVKGQSDLDELEDLAKQTKRAFAKGEAGLMAVV